jgi:hypothetical protein
MSAHEIGSVGLTESAGGGSRSSTVACEVASVLALIRTAEDAYSAVLVRPQRLVFGTLLAICGGCLRRHVCEWWGPCWCSPEKCPRSAAPRTSMGARAAGGERLRLRVRSG